MDKIKSLSSSQGNGSLAGPGTLKHAYKTLGYVVKSAKCGMWEFAPLSLLKGLLSLFLVHSPT